MSALGQKRTSEQVRIMSALPPKSDIRIGSDYVRRSNASAFRTGSKPRGIDYQRSNDSKWFDRRVALLCVTTSAFVPKADIPLRLARGGGRGASAVKWRECRALLRAGI